MTLIDSRPRHRLAPLEFAVTRNLAAKSARRSARRSSPTPASAALHRPHGRRLLVRAAADGTARACSRTARSRWTRPPPCCTTGRRSSRASRPTATPTGPSTPSAPTRTRRRLQRSARRLALPELPGDVLPPVAPRADRGRRRVGAHRRRTRACTCGPSCSRRRPSSASAPRRRSGTTSSRAPAGAYFKGGVQPVTIWLSTDYARAGKGGTGAAKTGGNYAASLLPQSEAYENGLRPGRVPRPGRLRRRARRHERRARLRRTARLITPAVRVDPRGHHARDSVLQLAEDRGHMVEQRKVSLDEWREGAASGDIVEVVRVRHGRGRHADRQLLKD